MELFFCDICNESVPQLDIEGGRARRRGERVICASCEQAMSHAETEIRAADRPGGASAADSGSEDGAQPVKAPAGGDPAPAAWGASGPPRPAPVFQPPPARGGVGLGSVLLVGLMAAAALVVVSVVTVFLVERIQESRVRSRAELAALEGRLVSGQRDLREDAARRADEDRAVLLAELDALRRSDREESDRLARRLGELESRLTELADHARRLGGVEARTEETRREVTRLSADLAQLGRDVGVLAERWMEAVAAGDVLDAEVAAAEEDVPDWLEHTTRLSSPSAATRWSAVTALGDTQDDRVVPYLVEMLDDTDIFVRMATARILEELGSREAVPELIEALDDDEAAVREAVVVALRAITGQNFRFDPTASEAERARRIKSWREWWKKSAS